MIKAVKINESNDLGEIMNTLTANEAKTHFGDMLLKAQREPIQIRKNGKPVAVVLSVDEYESFEALKTEMLRARALRAQNELNAGQLTDGDSFLDELVSGQHD